MKDSESEPVGVTVNGGEIIDIQDNLGLTVLVVGPIKPAAAFRGAFRHHFSKVVGVSEETENLGKLSLSQTVREKSEDELRRSISC